MLSLVVLLIALLHCASGAIDGAVVKLTMRDGVQLFALLYVPDSAQPVGTVLMRTPYNTSSLVPSCQTLFTLGFACLVADERGRFNSGGDYTFFRSAGNDTLDTMNWVRTQSWSNGKFSWTGVSANGITVCSLVHYKLAIAFFY
jgi:putative CocE/NonD family hydrolase